MIIVSLPHRAAPRALTPVRTRPISRGADRTRPESRRCTPRVNVRGRTAALTRANHGECSSYDTQFYTVTFIRFTRPALRWLARQRSECRRRLLRSYRAVYFPLRGAPRPAPDGRAHAGRASVCQPCAGRTVKCKSPPAPRPHPVKYHITTLPAPDGELARLAGGVGGAEGAEGGGRGRITRGFLPREALRVPRGLFDVAV